MPSLFCQLFLFHKHRQGGRVPPSGLTTLLTCLPPCLPPPHHHHPQLTPPPSSCASSVPSCTFYACHQAGSLPRDRQGTDDSMAQATPFSYRLGMDLLLTFYTLHLPCPRTSLCRLPLFPASSCHCLLIPSLSLLPQPLPLMPPASSGSQALMPARLTDLCA